MQQDVRVINELVRQESTFLDDVFNEVDKVIVGQRVMVERTLLGMPIGGHILLEVCHLAKTPVNTLAQTIKSKLSAFSSHRLCLPTWWVL